MNGLFDLITPVGTAIYILSGIGFAIFRMRLGESTWERPTLLTAAAFSFLYLPQVISRAIDPLAPDFATMRTIGAYAMSLVFSLSVFLTYLVCSKAKRLP